MDLPTEIAGFKVEQQMSPSKLSTLYVPTELSQEKQVVCWFHKLGDARQLILLTKNHGHGLNACNALRLAMNKDGKVHVTANGGKENDCGGQYSVVSRHYRSEPLVDAVKALGVTDNWANDWGFHPLDSAELDRCMDKLLSDGIIDQECHRQGMEFIRWGRAQRASHRVPPAVIRCPVCRDRRQANESAAVAPRVLACR